MIFPWRNHTTKSHHLSIKVLAQMIYSHLDIIASNFDLVAVRLFAVRRSVNFICLFAKVSRVWTRNNVAKSSLSQRTKRVLEVPSPGGTKELKVRVRIFRVQRNTRITLVFTLAQKCPSDNFWWTVGSRQSLNEQSEFRDTQSRGTNVLVGGPWGNRTPDLYNANVVLQPTELTALMYSRIALGFNKLQRNFLMFHRMVYPSCEAQRNTRLTLVFTLAH